MHSRIWILLFSSIIACITACPYSGNFSDNKEQDQKKLEEAISIAISKEKSKESNFKKNGKKKKEKSDSIIFYEIISEKLASGKIKFEDPKLNNIQKLAKAIKEGGLFD